MSTDRWPEGQLGQARGTLSLSAVESRKKFAIGYELGCCPGAAVHLGLRLEGRPASGVDGKPFPAAAWEQRPHFTLPYQSVELAGVSAFKSKTHVPGHTNTDENSELDRQGWKSALSAHKNVKAKWFVVHDTGGGPVPRNNKGADGQDSGVHMFMDQKRLFVHHDFSEKHTATKLEQLHTEFQGEFVHVEMVYPVTPDEAAEYAARAEAKKKGIKRKNKEILPPNPPAPAGGYNYDALALAYIFASYRAESWLTVTCHLECDRGIPDGHHDPRGFSFATFYKKIIAFVGTAKTPFGGSIFNVPPVTFPIVLNPPRPRPEPPPPGSLSDSSTFGILDERIGDNLNLTSYANTFPAQYGRVLSKTEFVCRSSR